MVIGILNIDNILGHIDGLVAEDLTVVRGMVSIVNGTNTLGTQGMFYECKNSFMTVTKLL